MHYDHHDYRDGKDTFSIVTSATGRFHQVWRRTQTDLHLESTHPTYEDAAMAIAELQRETRNMHYDAFNDVCECEHEDHFDDECPCHEFAGRSAVVAVKTEHGWFKVCEECARTHLDGFVLGTEALR